MGMETPTTALSGLKKKVAAGIKDVANGMFEVVNNLYMIESKGLFRLEKCGTMQEFIMKNKYNELMKIGVETIEKKLRIMHYKKRIKIPDKTFLELGWDKARILMQLDVDDPKEIAKYTDMPLNEMSMEAYKKKKKEKKEEKIVNTPRLDTHSKSVKHKRERGENTFSFKDKKKDLPYYEKDEEREGSVNFDGRLTFTVYIKNRKNRALFEKELIGLCKKYKGVMS